ncbi:hypothetical protein HY480_03680, partial [Candidatus Uhrbacteria bacterium]|nr:hypothetical protein [Candidatus Uhrbacteria bacterium]
TAPPTTTGLPDGALAPADLRRALLQQGLPSQLLDSLSDVQLVTTYQQMLQSIGTLPGGGASPAGGVLTNLFTRGLQTNATGSNANDLVSVLRAVPRDPVQIRQLLEANGIPKERFTGLDDAGILALWDQLIAALAEQHAAAPTKP